jgi:hypothetical protein
MGGVPERLVALGRALKRGLPGMASIRVLLTTLFSAILAVSRNTLVGGGRAAMSTVGHPSDKD